MKITISEETVKKITEKYVKSVIRPAATIPDIRKIISEAIHDAAPEREIDQEDISAVLKELSNQPIINDQVINEVAKKITDNSAREDLIFSIKTYAKQLKKKVAPKDIEDIIKKGKLDSYTSTPFQIKNAVRDYFEGHRPAESIPQNELKDIIRTELAKKGPIDERDVTTVLQKYLKTVDLEKPFKRDDIQNVIKTHFEDKTQSTQPEPERPEEPAKSGTTPVSRAETPSDEPEPPKDPAPPQARKSGPTPPVKPGDPVPPKDPKNLTFFEKIRMKMNRYGITSLTRFSRNWLKDTVNKATTTPARKKLLTQGQTVHEAFIGKMFLYFYDAKLKEELPYWDKFPLIICVDLADDGWYGLNLHYLPFPLRLKLFDGLLTLADDKRLDRMQKLRMSYGLVKGFSTFPEAKPCFKRYLASNVKSELLQIDPIDWETAIFLPVEMFQKQAKEKVWRDSKKTVKQGR